MIDPSKFRDRDLIVDSMGIIYQVIGSNHGFKGIASIPKYAPSKGASLWIWAGQGLQRLFREYTPQVANLSRNYCYSTSLKTYLPCVEASRLRHHFIPESGVQRLLHRASDPLERDALSLFHEIVDLGLASYRELGITGSILGGFHNPRKSDIDIVIYGREPSGELGSSIGRPLSRKEMLDWVFRNSRRLGISPGFVKRLYDPRRRFVYNGRLVTVASAPPRQGSLGSFEVSVRGTYVGIVEFFMEGRETGLVGWYYPHISAEGQVDQVIVGGVEEGFEAAVISFESLYAQAGRFGRLLVRGKGFIDDDKGVLTVLVGLREEHTFVLPVSF